MDGEITEMFKDLNQIFEEHSDGESKLTVQIFTNEKDEDCPAQTFVLLEGDRESLRFLAEVILAHLETDACDLSLHPTGAGCAHFSADSDLGLYLHLVPCSDGSLAKAVPGKARTPIG